MELFVWGHQTQGRQEARKKRAVTLKALERRTNSLLLLEGGGQEDKKSMHGANHLWRCVKSYSILLWERGVRRIMMWGRSLESKSLEGQKPRSPESRSPAERPDIKGDQSPVLSTQRLQICESQFKAREARVQCWKSTETRVQTSPMLLCNLSIH